jgi:hypothetical protein
MREYELYVEVEGGTIRGQRGTKEELERLIAGSQNRTPQIVKIRKVEQ